MDAKNKGWNRMSTRLSDLEAGISDMDADKIKCAKDKLAGEYRRFSVIALAFAFLAPSLLAPSIGPWLSLAFSAYFLTAMALHWDLSRRTRAIDPAVMPQAELARMAMDNRRRHHLSQLILIPGALLLLGWLVFTVAPSRPVLVGAFCAGVVLALTSCIPVWRRMMSCHSQLTR